MFHDTQGVTFVWVHKRQKNQHACSLCVFYRPAAAPKVHQPGASSSDHLHLSGAPYAQLPFTTDPEAERAERQALTHGKGPNTLTENMHYLFLIKLS